jgi:hypothetical protein
MVSIDLEFQKLVWGPRGTRLVGIFMNPVVSSHAEKGLHRRLAIVSHASLASTASCSLQPSAFNHGTGIRLALLELLNIRPELPFQNNLIVGESFSLL